MKYSPFAYNETVAHEYYPLLREDAVAQGLDWFESEEIHTASRTTHIPDAIRDVPNSIINEVLSCDTCGKQYRIITQELDFYRRMSLPVPRACPTCRHTERVRLRNPRILWQRNCTKCAAPITTAYSPERYEMPYCETCYLNLVYRE